MTFYALQVGRNVRECDTPTIQLNWSIRGIIFNVKTNIFNNINLFDFVRSIISFLGTNVTKMNFPYDSLFLSLSL